MPPAAPAEGNLCFCTCEPCERDQVFVGSGSIASTVVVQQYRNSNIDKGVRIAYIRTRAGIFFLVLRPLFRGENYLVLVWEFFFSVVKG